jgi:hypothetical protein
VLADAIAERKQGASLAISHQWAWPMVNRGTPHMDQAYPKSWFDRMGSTVWGWFRCRRLGGRQGQPCLRPNPRFQRSATPAGTSHSAQ